MSDKQQRISEIIHDYTEAFTWSETDEIASRIIQALEEGK